jgi:hypothetical protein
MFLTLGNRLLQSLRAPTCRAQQSHSPPSPPGLLRHPDESGLLAKTGGRIAEPAPNRKRRISLLAKTRKEGGVTKLLNEYKVLTSIIVVV